MKISLQYIKQHVAGIPADLTDQQLIQLIGSRLVEVEGVEDLAPKYQKAYIIKVVSAEPIEGTHLHLCQIDAGPVTADFLEPADAASHRHYRHLHHPSRLRRPQRPRRDASSLARPWRHRSRHLPR